MSRDRREPLHKWLPAANRDPSAIDSVAEPSAYRADTRSGSAPCARGGSRFSHRNPLAQRFPRGFTIVEVLAAMTLMTIALLGITMTGVATMRADSKSHNAGAATALAQAKLEQLRTLSRSDADWTGGSHSEAHINEEGTSVADGVFTRGWVVDLDYDNHPGLTRVTVTVSWAEDVVRSVTLSSLYW